MLKLAQCIALGDPSQCIKIGNVLRLGFLLNLNPNHVRPRYRIRTGSNVLGKGSITSFRHYESFSRRVFEPLLRATSVFIFT